MEFEGALYHLTARANTRQLIFLNEADRHSFLDLLGRGTPAATVELLCLLFDGQHYHLLVETPEANLSRRAANEPLAQVAQHFGVSPSRISKIQRELDSSRPTPQREHAMRECQVKH